MALGDILKTFTHASLETCFLAFDGRFFWGGNYLGGKGLWDHIYLYDREFNVLRDVDFGPTLDLYGAPDTTGIAVEGPFVYIVAEDDDDLSKGRFFMCDRALNVLKSWPLAMQYVDGILLRGPFIHINDWTNANHQIYSRDMTLLKEWSIPLADYEDLAFDGRFLYISEGWSETKFGVFTLDGTLLREVDLGVQIWGITFDGEFLWVSRWDTGAVHMVSRV